MKSWLLLVIFMENGNNSISVLIRQLNSPFFLWKVAYRTALNDDTFILKNYNKDYVEEKMLVCLILKSIVCPSIRLLLPDILYCTHEHSITDRVFRVCCKYPGLYRETLLISLAHMWLSQKQLNLIAQHIDAPEAFCKLFVMNAENNSLPVADFVSFLEMHNSYLNKVDIRRLIEVNNVAISQEKVYALTYALKDFYNG